MVWFIRKTFLRKGIYRSPVADKRTQGLEAVYKSKLNLKKCLINSTEALKSNFICTFKIYIFKQQNYLYTVSVANSYRFVPLLKKISLSTGNLIKYKTLVNIFAVPKS